MKLIVEIFGDGKELTVWQMTARAVLIFFITIVLIRISGKRSFGMRMPFDNVITILLGAVLSRAITGDSPFLSTVSAALVIALLHRLCAWIGLYSDAFGKLVKGESEVLYAQNTLKKDVMRKSLVSEKDLHEGMRINANVDTLEKIKEIYVERDGQISVVKKEEE